MKIPFSKVDCSGKEKNYIQQVLDSGWLTTASKALEFEKRFTEIIGVKYSFAVNSCTSALHLALDSIGISEGDKVLLPSMTFTSTAEVVRYLGGIPIFLDVEYGNSQLSEKIVEKALKKYVNVKAVIVVEFAGQPAPVLSKICKKYDVKLISDAAHAFPSRIGNMLVGNFADITCFSFYANKTITTGEGGMLVTNDSKIAERVKLMRLHGIDRAVWNRFNSDKPAWEYDVIQAGYKYNMPDINAAIGLAQLERAEEMRLLRQEVAEVYLDELKGIIGLDLPEINVPYRNHAWHIFSIVLNKEQKIQRQDMIDSLFTKGIGSSVHYKPLHRMTYYRNLYNLNPDNFPNTEKIWEGNFSLPIYSLLTKEKAKFIALQVKNILKG
jgi:dTDP-4-amino-4,6-dideoxygalactose transaminase